MVVDLAIWNMASRNPSLKELRELRPVIVFVNGKPVHGGSASIGW